jgi:hypothetical protein
MGFLGLIPADQVGALYEVRTRKLLLSAKGKVQEYTSGIAFHREPWLGGLKFALEGWTGPITQGVGEYTVEDSFDIQLPSPATPSGSVIVVTANHPKGIIVPIRFTGFNPPPPSEDPTSQKTSVSDAPTSDVVELAAPDDQINVLFKVPFSIKAAAKVPEFGSVDIIFDPKYLVLQSASIQNTEIVWTFDSIQTGHTQVIVVTYGGIAQFVMKKVYNVFIFLPKEDETAKGDAA